MVDLFDMSQFRNDFLEEAENIFIEVENRILGLVDAGKFSENMDKIILNIENLDAAAAFLGLNKIREICAKSVSSLKQLKKDNKVSSVLIEKSIFDMILSIKEITESVWGAKEVKNDIPDVKVKTNVISKKRVAVTENESETMLNLVEKMVLCRNELKKTISNDNEADKKVIGKLTRNINELKSITKYDDKRGMVIDVLLVRSGEGIYGIDIKDVTEIINRAPVSNDKILINNEEIDIIYIDKILNGKERGNQLEIYKYILIEKDKVKKALAVDEILEKTQAVKREFGNFLKNICGIKSAAIMGEDDIIMLVDKKIIADI